MKRDVMVRVGGRGTVVDGIAAEDESVTAVCDLCGQSGDATVSVSKDGDAPFACKNCLRERLEAMTLSLYLLAPGGNGGLPWGKISG
ncbi:MAG: hypothetical protein R3B13_32540 [Polyangiaceae bacterium]